MSWWCPTTQYWTTTPSTLVRYGTVRYDRGAGQGYAAQSGTEGAVNCQVRRRGAGPLRRRAAQGWGGVPCLPPPGSSMLALQRASPTAHTFCEAPAGITAEMLAGVGTSVADAQRLVLRHVGPRTLLASGAGQPRSRPSMLRAALLTSGFDGCHAGRWDRIVCGTAGPCAAIHTTPACLHCPSRSKGSAATTLPQPCACWPTSSRRPLLHAADPQAPHPHTHTHHPRTHTPPAGGPHPGERPQGAAPGARPLPGLGGALPAPSGAPTGSCSSGPASQPAASWRLPCT